MQNFQVCSFQPDLGKMEEANIQQLGIEAVKRTIKTKLGLDVFRGVCLKEIDRRLQGHDECALNAYLVWLQDQLNAWDFSDLAAFQPQIQSFCDRLRKRHFADQRILDSFRLWKSVQTKIDTSIERRILLVEGLLCQYLSFQKPTQPSSPQFHHRTDPHLDQPETADGQLGSDSLYRDESSDQNSLGRANTVAVSMEKKEVLEISSGDEDPDVEALGWKDANNKDDHTVTHRTVKPTSHKSASDKGGPTSYNGAYNDSHRGSQARKAGGRKAKIKKQGKTQLTNYICKRCGKPGHDLRECPTNLDPIYDTKPDPGYRCFSCGAQEEHYATLCPKNERPDSLIQLRIKAGITTEMQPQRRDRLRPSDDESEPGKRERRADMSGRIDNGFVHAERRVLLEPDFDDQIFEVRRAQLKRPYSRQKSPHNDQQPDGRDGSQVSSPPYKRIRWDDRDLEGRRDHDGEQAWDKRQIRDRGVRFVSPAESRHSSSNHQESSELLPSHTFHDGDKGRLSYWDEEYETRPTQRGPVQPKNILETEKPAQRECPSKIPLFSSSPLRVVKRPAAIDFWSNDLMIKEIEERFPGADPGWVREMASFNVDAFFDQMNDFMAARGTLQSEQQGIVDMETIMEVAQENGHCPRVDGDYMDMKGPEMVGRFERDETHDVQVKTDGPESAVVGTFDEDGSDSGVTFELPEDGAQHLGTGETEVVMRSREDGDDHRSSGAALVEDECAASTNPPQMAHFIPISPDIMEE